MTFEELEETRQHVADALTIANRHPSGDARQIAIALTLAHAALEREVKRRLRISAVSTEGESGIGGHAKEGKRTLAKK